MLEDVDGARAAVPASMGTNGLQRLNRGFVQHAVLNGVRLPLSAFTTIDLTRVKAIELRFDRTGAGRLSVADLAFTQEGVGSAAANTTGPTNLTPSQPACRSTAAAKWGCGVAQSLWGRDPDSLELQWLANGYRTAEGRRLVIAKAIGSQAASDLRHDQFVQTYIQDEVDPEWVRSVLSTSGRRTWEVATVELTAGFAFAGSSMGTTEATIDAAYEAIVGRPADPEGLAYWTPRVEAKGPTALARSLVRTTAARTRIVDERYLQILGRTPDPSGRTYWVNRLASDGGEQALVASLLATESFRAAATH